MQCAVVVDLPTYFGVSQSIYLRHRQDIVLEGMSSAAPLPHDVTTTKSRNKSKITNNESLLFAMIAQVRL